MKHEPKTRNTISLVVFLLGLAGIAYSIWSLFVESDLEATLVLVLSIMFIIGAYYFLIKDNDKYPPGLDQTVYHFLLCYSIIIIGLTGVFFPGNINDGPRYFSVLAISVLVLFFAAIYEILWRKRIK